MSWRRANTHHREALRAAAVRLERAQQDELDAVRAAREANMTWDEIAAALGSDGRQHTWGKYHHKV